MPTSGGTGSSNIADDISPSEVGKNTPHTRVDIGAIAVIVIFSCLLCLPILVGRVPVPAESLSLWAPWGQLPHEPITNPHLADGTLLYLPSTVFARQAVADSEWPMWDPYSF